MQIAENLLLIYLLSMRSPKPDRFLEVLMETRREKILIIDDDPFFLKMLSVTFQENGFEIATANDGIAGIKAYLDHLPDVVISDLIMPKMGGVSTCMEITRLAGGNEPIIILMTSMFKGPPHEHKIAEMGAKIHIPKTTNPLDVVIIVEQLLYRKKMRQGPGKTEQGISAEDPQNYNLKSDN
jgi:two-component system, OmpR family, response regulator